ncbi:MAG: DUF5946 family protein [Gemmatimonadota bacterium]|nr:DUF5946 family protein [Gemmatimonadota bacterium]MDH3424290.1 DUF5946 family protein [Gemmatimonadota bacterium]
MKADVHCPECGAPGVADPDACNVVFQTVVGWEFGRPELFGVHGLTVDAYSLQHPDRYMESSKSAAAHLAGLCWRVEGRDVGDSASISKRISGWLDGRADLPRVEPPPKGERGALTIMHVFETEGDARHVERVQEWARSVWSAWTVGHAQARAWLEALGIEVYHGRGEGP